MLSGSATPWRRFRRTAAQLAVVAAAAAGIVVVPAAAASASVSASVWNTGGDNLYVRSSPSTSAAVVASLAPDQSVTVDCQTTGPTINGTSIWDHLPAYGGYATDAYLYTGYDGWDPDLPRCGSTGGIGAAVVATAQAQIGNGPTTYTDAGGVSSDTPWCSLFVSWVWRQNGIPAPEDVYSGDLFDWSYARGQAHYGTSGIRPGDAVFFGDGPQQPSGDYVPSVHVGIVVSVNGDGTLNTVEGNYWLNGVSRVVAPGAFDPTVPRADVGLVYGYAHPA